MYRYSKEVPWRQDKIDQMWRVKAGLLMLEKKAPYETILDVGCGLGYLSRQMKNLCSGIIDAFDVSPEAIRRAQQIHPGINFYVDDLLREDFRPKRTYDLVAVHEILWYVCHEMGRVVRNLDTCLKPGGYLYIGQFFPPLHRPFVGKEIIPDPNALIAFFHQFLPVSQSLVIDHELPNDGPVLHYLTQKKVCCL